MMSSLQKNALKLNEKKCLKFWKLAFFFTPFDQV
jgi:hypothetical protein